MQFPQLQNWCLDEEMFQTIPGSQPKRKMYYEDEKYHNEEMMKNDHPILFQIFTENLALCKQYVRYETSIRADLHFYSHNILGNYLAVREQYVHCDYPKK